MVDAYQLLEGLGGEGEVDGGFESSDGNIGGIQERILAEVEWQDCLISSFGFVGGLVSCNGCSFESHPFWIIFAFEDISTT